MDEALLAKVVAFRIPILIGLVGFFFVCLGLILTFHKSSSPPVEISQESVASSASSLIHVDIAGAVEHPGMYSLPYDSRVQELLTIAGGLTPDRDDSYINKTLNRAAKLSDGAKIYIPKKSEQQVAGSKEQGQSSNNTSSLVNINSAGLSQLDTLPGIGPVTAQKIIDGRPYQRIEQLVDKKIINQATWEKIKDKISLY